MKKIFLVMSVLFLCVFSGCSGSGGMYAPASELYGNVWLADSQWQNQWLFFNAVEFHKSENMVRFVSYADGQKYPCAEGAAYKDYEFEYSEEGGLIIYLFDKAEMEKILLQVGATWDDVLASECSLRSEFVLLGKLVQEKNKTGIRIGKKTYWKTEKEIIDDYVQQCKDELYDGLVKRGLDPSFDYDRLNFPYIPY